MPSDSFRDRAVLLTGAAGGFGTLLAAHLAEAGARLLLSDLASQPLEALAQDLRQRGAQVLAVPADVCSEESMAELVSAAVEAFGALDIAVNNAGMSAPMKPFIETTGEDFDRNYAVNARGVFFGMKYQIRQMLTQEGGTILNVASKAGIGGAPNLAAYCAAKHAVVGLTRTAALEYARHNIRVNAVCPYFSPTPLLTGGTDEALRAQLAKRSPMKRLGEPEEMVQAMLMLIAPENSYLTGQAIAVDGGASA